MAKRKIEYRDEGGKIRWFWNTDAKWTREKVFDPDGENWDTLYELRNSAWVLETVRGYPGEDCEHTAREVSRGDALSWLQEHRQIRPDEEWPCSLRDLAEGNRAKRPRTPPGEVKKKIEGYLAEHAEEAAAFRELVENGQGDEPLFRSVFGRNIVARACGLSGDAVSRFPQWREVAAALRLID